MIDCRNHVNVHNVLIIIMTYQLFLLQIVDANDLKKDVEIVNKLLTWNLCKLRIAQH